MIEFSAFVAGVCGFILLVNQSSHDFSDTRRLILGGALLGAALVLMVLDRLLPEKPKPWEKP